MEHLPSLFNEFWDFLIRPLIEFSIIIGLFIYFADKTDLKSKSQKLGTLIFEKFNGMQAKILEPLGIKALTAFSIIGFFICVIVLINRTTHTIGDLIPGNLLMNEESSYFVNSVPEELADIWSSKPEIKNASELINYINYVNYKEIVSYPEMLKNYTLVKEMFGDIWVYRSFEKFLFLYVVLLAPLLFRCFKIKTKGYLRKAVLVCVILFGLLFVNFYHQYENNKQIILMKVYYAHIILTPQIAQGDLKKRKEFLAHIISFRDLNSHYALPTLTW